MSVIVELDKVGKNYQSLQALKEISLRLGGGEVLGLFGHNGAGKTTLMKLILGLIKADSGQVKVFGIDPTNKAAWNGRKSIGYLPENVSFYDQLTGLEVLTYFAKLKGYNKKDAVDLLDKVGLSHALKRQVKTYSKGMRQRLGLAQAFIGEPQLLLLDEPTVGLDPIATTDFYQNVDELKTHGCAIVLCSHVLPGVERHINRAVILSSGQVKAVGTVDELAAQADLPVRIKAEGLNGALQNNPQYQGFLLPGREGEMAVSQAQKLEVMQQLLAQPNLRDLTVQPPSLEQLYQHYINL